MRNVACVSLDKSSFLILSSLEWSPTQFVLQCDHWFHDGLIFFFHYLLLLERTFGWALSPLFVLHSEWSLTLITHKKSNTVCTFANLCSTLFSLWFKFSSAWFYFLSKCKKRGQKLIGKNLNVDRQFFKDVIRNFWWHSV